jgi:hypothetical protein
VRLVICAVRTFDLGTWVFVASSMEFVASSMEFVASSMEFVILMQFISLRPLLDRRVFISRRFRLFFGFTFRDGFRAACHVFF